MVDKKIKKILIFACPRSGTTIIQKMIEDKFGLRNLSEPFTDPELGFNPATTCIPNDLYKWTTEQLTGVIKLLAINLPYVDVGKLLLVGKFDQIVIIKRKNLVDCCVSLCLAELTNKYHYREHDSVNIDPFECSGTFVDNWIAMYKRYTIALEQITNSNILVDVIYYEDFMNNQVQYVAGAELQASKMNVKVLGKGKQMISLNLFYKELCINYQEVEEKIRKELC